MVTRAIEKSAARGVSEGWNFAKTDCEVSRFVSLSIYADFEAENSYLLVLEDAEFEYGSALTVGLNSPADLIHSSILLF